MFRYSIKKASRDSETFGISNIELGDGYFKKNLVDLNGDELEDIRSEIIDNLQRIVLYTVKSEMSLDSYIKVFRNAHALGIENLKPCMRTYSEKDMATLAELTDLARSYGIKLLFGLHSKHPWFTFETYMKLRSDYTGIIFSPLEIVKTGKGAFLEVLYKAKIKDDIVFMRINDGLISDGSPTHLEHGNAEVKECVSALCARSFKGYLAIEKYCEDITEEQTIKELCGMLKRL